MPHLAYADKLLDCHSCKKGFVFSKEEKKAWYESYTLPISAQPDNCLDCRRKIQKHNAENKLLSEILKKEEDAITDDELEQVVGIYTSWDKMEQSKYYLSLLIKRGKKR
ncbi:zinc-ribbon domain containing protein [Flavobacterium sp.]